MKRKILQYGFACIIAAAGSIPAAADVNFTLYPDTDVLGPLVSFVDQPGVESRMEKYPNSFFINNNAVLSKGVILSNTLGYPNGKAIIKPFPSMEFGIASGAGVYQYKRYQDFDKDDPKVPGGGVNGAFHFGTGFSERSDVTFKLFIDAGWIPVNKTVSKNQTDREYDIKMKDYSFISTGAKWRYNIVKGSDPSWLFNFGGITGSVAADFMHARVKAGGTYIDKRAVEFKNAASNATADEQQQTLNVVSTVNGSASVGWDLVSVTPEIIVYADLFKFFSFYTGPAVSLNAGYYYVQSRFNGEMVNMDAVTTANGTVTLIAAGSSLARAEMVIDEASRVPFFMPKWTVGLELNFWMVKLQLEAATILTSPLDSFCAQAGIRTQF